MKFKEKYLTLKFAIKKYKKKLLVKIKNGTITILIYQNVMD